MLVLDDLGRGKCRNIYSTWSDIFADDKKELSKYYSRFENYVKPRSNEVYNRYTFQTRSENEPNRSISLSQS